MEKTASMMLMKYFSWFYFALIIVAVPNTVWGQLQVTSLRVEHMENPMTVDAARPRLSWINVPASPKARGEKQSAYRICVASSLKALNQGRADVWDSGRTPSEESNLISYGGKPLESGRDYWWRVMTWNGQGKASRWSSAEHWGMGLLHSSDWKARWIAGPEGVAAPLLRKTFRASGDIVSAKVFVTSLGYFELYANGRRVGEDCLVPNFTNYTRREGLKQGAIVIDDHFRAYRVLYLAYDLTPYLRSGATNAVGAILGDGFYRCQQHWVCSYGQPAFLCQTIITYRDGRKDTIATDGSWRTHPSAIVMNGVYAGEVYDARQEIKGWSAPAYDDHEWTAAAEVKAPDGQLSAQCSPSDRVTERLSPYSLQRQADGSYVVDFGKEISGWIRFQDLEGRRGDTLRVHYVCESPLGVEEYIFKGEGKESYAPRFTWYVFRKAIVTGVSRLDKTMLTAEAVNTDVHLTASFHTSNPLFNQINEIWRRSQLDNLHGCIASDCPHRERSPYTGDGQVACQTVMANFDASAFYQKWIRDMRDAQNVETGYVPNGAPWQPGCGGGVAWGAAMCIMPWQYYIHYGDRRMLEDSYTAMKEQLRSMLTWLKPDSTMLQQMTNAGSSEPNYWLNLGEWIPPYGMPSTEVVHTFYLWRCADYMARAAHALGCTEDYVRYASLAEGIRRAFHRKFYDAGKRSYGDFGCNVFALAMGVPSDRYRDVVETLRREITETHQGHLNTGMLGTQYFFETLAQNGLNDVAYGAMNKTDFPSYGNWIRQGATTTWEQWNGKDSRNHPVFGGGLTWFYRCLAGIRADEQQPGFRHILFCPMLTDSLQEVHYSQQTPYGLVSSDICHTETATSIQLTIPVGSSATLYLPASSAVAVTESGRALSAAPGLQYLRSSEGRIVVEAQQGTFHFQINNHLK